MYNYFLHLRTALTIRRKELLEVILSKNNNEYTPFVILCEPRTGSTLLHTYLNFHPNVKSFGEALREQVEQYHTSNPQFLKNNIFKSHSKHLKAIGLKLFYFYYDHPVYADTFKEIVDKKNVRVIHLIRKDIFAIYASLKLAQKTNIWSLSSNTKTKARIFIKPDEFKLFAETYLQRQLYFKNLFSQHPVLYISYEDLVNNTQTVLEEVQQFLGVKPRVLLSLLKKQNQDPLESVIINYNEVHAAIEKILKELNL